MSVSSKISIRGLAKIWIWDEILKESVYWFFEESWRIELNGKDKRLCGEEKTCATSKSQSQDVMYPRQRRNEEVLCFLKLIVKGCELTESAICAILYVQCATCARKVEGKGIDKTRWNELID